MKKVSELVKFEVSGVLRTRLNPWETQAELLKTLREELAQVVSRLELKGTLKVKEVKA